VPHHRGLVLGIRRVSLHAAAPVVDAHAVRHVPLVDVLVGYSGGEHRVARPVALFQRHVRLAVEEEVLVRLARHRGRRGVRALGPEPAVSSEITGEVVCDGLPGDLRSCVPVSHLPAPSRQPLHEAGDSLLQRERRGEVGEHEVGIAHHERDFHVVQVLNIIGEHRLQRDVRLLRVGDVHQVARVPVDALLQVRHRDLRRGGSPADAHLRARNVRLQRRSKLAADDLHRLHLPDVQRDGAGGCPHDDHLSIVAETRIAQIRCRPRLGPGGRHRDGDDGPAHLPQFRGASLVHDEAGLPADVRLQDERDAERCRRVLLAGLAGDDFLHRPRLARGPDPKRAERRRRDLLDGRPAVLKLCVSRPENEPQPVLERCDRLHGRLRGGRVLGRGGAERTSRQSEDSPQRNCQSDVSGQHFEPPSA